MERQTSVRQIDLGEGLFIRPKSPSQEPHLLGSRCTNCKEVIFPKQRRCANCSSEAIEEIALSPRGKLHSFTNVNYPVPDGYKGPVPYGVGMVELPEGVRVMSHLTESDPNKLFVGMDMALVIDKLFEDEDGTEVIGFKFKPILG
ncbi:MAG: Zn-ribbon domain-containing OB-fold protein [Aromatoleum sp.]|uniref:Zn-ribbon domain-containing OB-fold protein n=1 Tax=Aromatoleum sp. TaxID=2307007 RepID=UPI002894C0C7|nr:Zn-ribbon domain-containing OB-fold protein [Aromatoleum sp.]MDT3669903.1 Zn-ribbon domain-containing OB-fold protein [Aromatoleum sp.]